MSLIVDATTAAWGNCVTERGLAVGGEPKQSRVADAACGRRGAVALLASLVAGCAASPWDFPVPVMVGNQQGTSMTGFMATSEEAEVRRRLTERMKCPGTLDFASLETQRADATIGTRMLHYKAVMVCRPAGQAPGGGEAVARDQ